MAEHIIDKFEYDSEVYKFQDNVSGYAPLASPALTGTPTAPTATSGDSSTQIATTAFVQDAVSGAGAGTVTSVGLSNATNGGLSISGSPITSSGSITVGHSNVLTSAQTTSGIYPIKIDKNGHISEYGSAVSIPTKTSDLTNDSGFVTTDEKVKLNLTTSGNSYGIILTSDSVNKTNPETQYYDPSISFYTTAASGKLNGSAALIIGSSTQQGAVCVFNADVGSTTLVGYNASSDRTISFPDASGTIALTSDIPTVPTISLNGSSTTSASFYAPTSAGTSGYYLKSNGSGAPTWVSLSNFVGTDGTSAGSSGLVPGPATTDDGKYLKASGDWDTPDDTTYVWSMSSNTLRITPSNGTIPTPDNDTTYAISISGNVITLTGSDQSVSSVTVPANTTYTLTKSGGIVTLNGSDGNDTSITVATKTSDLTNDSGFITSSSLATVATSGSYNDLSNKPSIPTITDTYSGTSSDGMSGKAVKSAIDALDGTISGSASSSKTLTAFSQTNGIVSATFGNISITKSQVSDFPSLATVATSGSYSDLSGTPSLATVATSGSYSDLSNKPTIPTVNDATLTIQKNGTNVATFTANASSNVTANISVQTIYASTSDPTSGDGVDGDVWFVYTASE